MASFCSIRHAALQSGAGAGADLGWATAGPAAVVAPAEINDADKVGSVSANRYAEIVSELRKLVETASRIQFTVGDYALEVEPMREAGGQERSDALFTVKESLFRLAEDIGLSYAMVDEARWTAPVHPPCTDRSCRTGPPAKVVQRLSGVDKMAISLPRRA